MIQEATGMSPKRNLEQYRAGEEGDLLGVHGWTVECKIRSSGTWPEEKWWAQVSEAARKASNRPALVFRLCRQPIRVMLMSCVEGRSEPIRMVMEMKDWLAMLGSPSSSGESG